MTATGRVTILFDGAPALSTAARIDGDELWVAPEDVAAATGWVLKAHGLCRDEACVPLPADGSWRDDAGRLALTRFAARFDRPVVHDDAHGLWAFGPPAADGAERDASVQAPDFTLPDLDGRAHSLSDYRGRKVLVKAWGSY